MDLIKLIFWSNDLGVWVLGRLNGKLLLKSGRVEFFDEKKFFLYGSNVEEEEKIFFLNSLNMFNEILVESTPSIDPYLKLLFKKKLIFLKLYSYVSIFFFINCFFAWTKYLPSVKRAIFFLRIMR